MAEWSSHTSLYKAGVVVLFLGFVLYLIGFAAPFWVQAQHSHFGLWQACFDYGSSSTCLSSVTGRQADWYKAWQAMACLGLVGMAGCCVYTLRVSCCRAASLPSARLLHLLAFFSGLIGFIGCMIFVGKTRELLSTAAEDYSWAFACNLAGCILVLIAGAITRTSDPPSPATTATSSTNACVTYAGGVPVQGVSTVTMQHNHSRPSVGQSYVPYGAQPGCEVAPGYGAPQAGYVHDPRHSGRTQTSEKYCPSTGPQREGPRSHQQALEE